MSNTTSPGKKYPGRPEREDTHINTSTDLQESGNQYFPAGVHGAQKQLKCVPIQNSDMHKITVRMSPESQKILTGTKWSENGFIPSFKVTDKILMKAARRTYNNTHGTEHR